MFLKSLYGCVNPQAGREVSFYIVCTGTCHDLRVATAFKIVAEVLISFSERKFAKSQELQKVFQVMGSYGPHFHHICRIMSLKMWQNARPLKGKGTSLQHELTSPSYPVDH